MQNIIQRNYYRGLNLGGWLSQCNAYTQEHYNTFILEEDIQLIKSLGFDHVRLPFDYHLLLTEDNLDDLLASGMEHLDRAIVWCKNAGLNVILDLHKAPGYSFDTKRDNQLFEDQLLQKKAIGIWRQIAESYKGIHGDEVMFELLNEIVEPDSSRWNLLATKMIEAIRSVDEERYIMVGGNNYNSCGDMKNLPIFDDEKVVYTFHFYEPIMFTHQKASWFDKGMAYDMNLQYPGDYKAVETFVEKHPEYIDMLELKKEGLNIDAMKKYFQPAVDFIGANPTIPVYCGEFGVISLTDLKSRVNWHRDLMQLLEENQIGSACWSYRRMDFELIDELSKPVSKELMEILSGKA